MAGARRQQPLGLGPICPGRPSNPSGRGPAAAAAAAAVCATGGLKLCKQRWFPNCLNRAASHKFPGASACRAHRIAFWPATKAKCACACCPLPCVQPVWREAGVLASSYTYNGIMQASRPAALLRLGMHARSRIRRWDGHAPWWHAHPAVARPQPQFTAVNSHGKACGPVA